MKPSLTEDVRSKIFNDLNEAANNLLIMRHIVQNDMYISSQIVCRAKELCSEVIEVISNFEKQINDAVISQSDMQVMGIKIKRVKWCAPIVSLEQLIQLRNDTINNTGVELTVLGIGEQYYDMFTRDLEHHLYGNFKNTKKAQSVKASTKGSRDI